MVAGSGGPNIDPGSLLPAPGVIEILFKAAESAPILALGMVLTFLLIAVGIAAAVIIAGLRYKALCDPQAAETLRGMGQDDKTFKLAMQKLENDRKERTQIKLLRHQLGKKK